MEKLIHYLDQHHLLRENVNKVIETETLYALVDGIAIHAMLEPQRVDKDRILQVLTHYLQSICIDN